MKEYIIQKTKANFSHRNVEISWGKSIETSRNEGVKESAQRWYMKRVEGYNKAAQGRKMHDHSRDDINRYLEEQGRKKGLQGWQFLQVVDTIQFLLKTTDTPAGTQVNWGFWSNSAQEPADSHPTIARTGGVLPSAEPAGRAPLLDAMRARHGSVLDDLVVVVRQSNRSRGLAVGNENMQPGDEGDRPPCSFFLR